MIHGLFDTNTASRILQTPLFTYVQQYHVIKINKSILMLCYGAYGNKRTTKFVNVETSLVVHD